VLWQLYVFLQDDAWIRCGDVFILDVDDCLEHLAGDYLSKLLIVHSVFAEQGQVKSARFILEVG
jgi:hypothetical protein